MIHDSEEIANTFRKLPRTKLNCAVVTASDSQLFRHFQLLYLSLKYSHEVPIYLFDLGITQEETAWCRKQPNLEVLPARGLIFPKSVNGWQTYSKPVYIQACPHPLALWIDCDCIVLKNLSQMANLINEHPVTTLCYHWPGAPRNSPDLHSLLGSKIVENPPYVNAGVCGFHLERDQQLLLQWEWVLRRAAADENIKNRIVFWDQGALQWALEKNNFLGREVLHDEKWNSPICFGTDFKEVLNLLRHSPHTIVHAAGRGKVVNGKLVSTMWKQ